jgi:hypothetical protein
MNKKIVIKIGGSFIKVDNIELLKNIIEVIEDTAFEEKNIKMIIVNGGGRAADLVRNFDSVSKLKAKNAHFAAISAVELNAYLISDFFKEFSFFSQNISLPNRINIFLPLLYYKNFDPLPNSWQVTSDTMALETAERISADKLILLKQKDTINNENTSSIRADKLSESGLIDKYFPILFEEVKKSMENKIEAVIINANYPQRIKDYLKNKNTSMIKII